MKLALHLNDHRRRADLDHRAADTRDGDDLPPAGLFGQIVTTLDLLSGGRVWLGIGTGWNEQEATGLGLPFDDHGRCHRLEQTLRICLQMWSGSREANVTPRY